MSRAALFFLLGGLLAVACRNESSESRNSDAVPEDFAFTFQCEQQRGADINVSPAFSVYAIAEEYKVKLAEIDTCTAIPKVHYDQYRIPNDALAAAGSVSTNGGSYFYALRRDRQIVIFQGSRSTQPESDPIAYELLATYEEGRFRFHH